MSGRNNNEFRGGSRAAAISKMKRFVKVANGFILDVAASLDSPRLWKLGNKLTIFQITVCETAVTKIYTF